MKENMENKETTEDFGETENMEDVEYNVALGVGDTVSSSKVSSVCSYSSDSSCVTTLVCESIEPGNKENNENTENADVVKGSKTKKRKKRRPSYERGIRGELMNILLSCGCISYRGLRVLIKETRLYSRKLSDMTNEGLVRKVKLETRTAVAFSSFSTKYESFIDYYPIGYYGYYMNYGETYTRTIGTYDSKPVKAERANRNSEVLMLMHAAGVSSVFGEKPLIEENKIPATGSYYYSSLEVKNSGGYKMYVDKDTENKKEVVNSRAYGVLLSNGVSYVLYHTGKAQLKWSNSSESTMQICTEKMCVSQYTKAANRKACIVFGYTDVVFTRIFENIDHPGLLGTKNCYQKMYTLPYSSEGREMLRIMTIPNWEEMLKEDLLEEYNTKTERMSYVCDAVSENVSILLFCIPDIIKLRKFLSHAKMVGNRESFHIYCFDYQIPFVSSVVGEYAEIYSVPMAEYVADKTNS